MDDPIKDAFSDLATIPGSRKKLADDRAERDSRRPQKVKKELSTNWDRRPLKRAVGHTTMEFFTASALAEALGKQRVTVNKWIRRGWLPKPHYRTPVSGGNGGYKLWTRAEIEAIVKVAEEENIFAEYHPDIADIERFAARMKQLWPALKGK